MVYAMVTSGEAGIDGMDPAEARRVREAEQRESARIVGVEVVDFLGLTDGVLEYGVELRRAICTAVRRHRPEIVITNNFRDTWGGQTLNQADHIATGRATLDAVRDAANRWVFHEQIEDGLERWAGVRQVWASSSPEGTRRETTKTSSVESPRWPLTRPTSTVWAGILRSCRILEAGASSRNAARGTDGGHSRSSALAGRADGAGSNQTRAANKCAANR